MESTSIVEEIDNAHSAANLALLNNDFASYINHFSDSLKYKQPNGKTIDKNQLAKDTRHYFNRIQSCKTSYERLNFSFDNGLFTETLVQKATVVIKVFFFFSKKWTVERSGIYKWIMESGEWKILDVGVTKEKVY